MLQLSKSEFAREMHRDPAQVTRWIDRGLIDGDALTADGQINVDAAKAQLLERLDFSQQLSQRAPIVADAEDVDPDEAAAPTEAEAKKRFFNARAEAKELEVEEQRRRLSLAQGRFLDTEQAKRAWGKEFAAALQEIEIWIGEVAKDLAVELQIDERTATIIVRKSWRAFRERKADAAAAQLAQAAE